MLLQVRMPVEEREALARMALRTHCKTPGELIRKMAVIMDGMPPEQFKAWFFDRLKETDGPTAQ